MEYILDFGNVSYKQIELSIANMNWPILIKNSIYGISINNCFHPILCYIHHFHCLLHDFDKGTQRNNINEAQYYETNKMNWHLLPISFPFL